MTGVQAVRLPDGTSRHVVRYEDFDGISLLASRDALRTRYRDHDAIVAPSMAMDVNATLLSLANAGEVVAWGTHQTDPRLAVLSLTPFENDELEANGMKSTLEVGCLTLTGDLYVGAWHTLTYGCDYERGELECPRVSLRPGRYRVTVHRPFSATDEEGPEEATMFMIHLERVADDAPSPTLAEVPGADGWF